MPQRKDDPVGGGALSTMLVVLAVAAIAVVVGLLVSTIR